MAKTTADVIQDTVTQSGKAVIETTTKVVNSEGAKQVGNSLKEAGTHLVTTVDGIFASLAKAFPEVTGKGFEFYAHYIFAQGVAQLFEGLALILLGVSFFAMWYKFIFKKAMAQGEKETGFNSDNYGVSIAIAIPFLIIMLICVVQGIYSLTDGIVYVVAPEGVVVKDIIQNLPKV